MDGPQPLLALRPPKPPLRGLGGPLRALFGPHRAPFVGGGGRRGRPPRGRPPGAGGRDVRRLVPSRAQTRAGWAARRSEDPGPLLPPPGPRQNGPVAAEGRSARILVLSVEVPPSPRARAGARGERRPMPSLGPHGPRQPPPTPRAAGPPLGGPKEGWMIWVRGYLLGW
eukprot:scaffold781_cov394-Prasinococcus_capsulatus_cf.AAC.23